ncbi:MAG TPA: SDR family oxidoreductase [Vicinamibacterales bacterium]|nr:SDR family oxidoreductase [Vicinamibacterales bacterium]
MARLEGKSLLVTGGARGIGRAVAEKCAGEGARVSFFDLNEIAGRRAEQELRAAGLPVDFLRIDVTSENDVARGIARIEERHGHIDILVNNAGVNAYFDPVEMTEAQWDEVFAVDLKGAWLCAKYVLPGMRERRSGSIVNIASIHASLTIAGMFPYAAAKSGLVGLTRSLALDCAPLGIRVNAVSPGWTRTHLVEEWFGLQPDPIAAELSVMKVHPLGRIATAAEIANVVAFVASDEASAMTGAAVNVDCGLGIQFST